MAVSSRTELILQLARDSKSAHSTNSFNEVLANTAKRKLSFDSWEYPDQMENIQLRKQHRGEFNIDHLDRLSREELVEKIKVLYSHNVQLKNIIAKSGGSKKKKQHLKQQRQFDFENCNTRHVLLKFYYAGWDYCGYATQEDTINTIEHYLFEGLVKTCLIKDRTTSNYHRCGRTDKGVSSFGQVISIDLRSKLEKDDPNLDNEINYCWILNKVLPDAIQCVAWCPVDDEFSSRFNCNGRTYKYFFPKSNLNIENMKTAAKFMLGTHDFRNFCKMDVGNGVIKFFRTINSIEILPSSPLEIKNSDEFSMYVLTIQGQAFLWHQIRYLMGVLILVGENREKPTIVQDLLNVELNPRKPDYNMASEVPLNLYYCDYDDINETEWMYNQTAMSIVLSKLQSMWTFSSVKSTMLENMLRDLYKVCEKNNIETRSEYNNCLLSGVRSKSYIPLMERQKCESLESKIKHFVKRQRIEMLDETSLENST